MVAAALSGAGAAGCGGDSDRGGGDTSLRFEPRERFSEAKREFIDRADRICSVAMAAGSQLPEDPRSAAEWYVTGRGNARLLRTAIRSVLVLELPPPPDMDGARAFKRAARDILAGVRDVERETRGLRAAIEARDAGRAKRQITALERALERTTGLDARSIEVARDYGMNECAADGSGPELPDDLELEPEI